MALDLDVDLAVLRQVLQELAKSCSIILRIEFLLQLWLAAEGRNVLIILHVPLEHLNTY
jgi:hypothetical protein